ncbi:hypothetical protein [Aquimarina pacifica]|uniref:hypothetical protein n=1 Tax=Aquimarina pacifica TaxID=1296415 RepID=UPI000471B0D6|nr:hypothetical protein [Aquimarina pacifica]
MKQLKNIILFLFIVHYYQLQAQESNDANYIEFNDRKNIVHGVYLGFNMNYGEIDGKETIGSTIKLAYVANRKVEFGFAIGGFYSKQNITHISTLNKEDLGGVYAGIHIEPIFFSKSKINLSLPLFVGVGVAAYTNTDANGNNEINEDDDNLVGFSIVKPGISILYNISRYVQLETGIKYRFSSKFDLHPTGPTRIDGVSLGLGLKVGVFNLGRNRYKKNIQNDK